MKKLTTILLSGGLSLSVSAQSYDALWKKVQTESDKDLPKSALASVEQIRLKAVAEKNDAQLLRASLMNLVFNVEISPDSLTSCIAAMEESLAEETRPVVQALWHSALAKAYDENAWKAGHDFYSEMTAKSIAHAEASLLHPEALAEARVKDYLPLFVEQENSRFFNNDLLHVVFSTYTDCVGSKEKIQTMRNRLIGIYRDSHADNAVVRLTLDGLSSSRRYYNKVEGAVENDDHFRSLSTLLDTYPDAELAPCIVEAMTGLQGSYSSDNAHAVHNDSLLLALAEDGVKRYGKNQYANSLRNFISKMNQPQASLKNLPAYAVPGEDVTLRLKGRHTESVVLRITRIANDDMKETLRDENLEDLAKSNRKNAVLTTYELDASVPTYVWTERDVALRIPDNPGVYAAELLVGGKVVSTSSFHVSALKAMVFAYPDGQNRVVAVEASTGRPVGGAKVSQYVRSASTGNYSQAKVYICGKDGAVIVSSTNRNGTFYVWTDADRASEGFGIGNVKYYGASQQKTRTTVDLYTDRTIYRPGQKVEVSGIAYTRTGDDFHTEKAFRAKLTLFNANYKKIDSLLVETDAYGMFSGAFTLPKSVLPGSFVMRLEGGSVNTSKRFSVEEYKRPTFTATTDPVRTAYALGDTVEVEGRAETYTGVAVPGARVQYTINRNCWFRYGSSDGNDTVNGETTTDSEGRFRISVTLTAPDDNDRPQWTRYAYSVSYTVTADNGESASGSASLQTSTRRTWVEHDVPQRICRESGKDIAPFHPRQMNAAGEVMEGTGSYSLLNASGTEVASGTFASGSALTIDALRTLPEGMYSLSLRGEGADEADTTRFALFSYETKSPVDKSEALFAFDRYADKRDSVHVMVGSPRKGVTLFVDELAEGKLLRSQRYELSDSVLHFNYTYLPEYGDGLTVYYAFVQDGTLYTHRVFVEKPVPEKKLQLTWQTFRSRLEPGADETWTLRVTHADGSPANSQVMAVLYDASLDALGGTPSWNFSNLGFSRSATRANWSWLRSTSSTSLSYGKEMKLLDEPSASGFTYWNPWLFSYGTSYGASLRNDIIQPCYSRVAPLAHASVIKYKVADDREMDSAEELSSLAETNGFDESTGSASATTVRKNFSETAFFRPNLHTDANGLATLSFTLPESTTQWHFHALAHTTAMDYGSLDTMAVARKEFMVQPAMPRFVRQGDTATLPVQLTNLSASAVDATLNVELRDALTDKVVFSEKQKVSLGSGEVKVVPFTYAASTDAAMLVCRATATGKNFSDGEEHYLPVLSSRVEVTRTLPFSLKEKGTHTWKVDTLFNAADASHRRLTVELTSNPTWTAVSALPALAADASCTSANEWATRLYAIKLGQYVAECNPAIAQAVKQHPDEADALSRLDLDEFTDLTPWLQNARSEQQRIASLRNLFDEERAAADLATAQAKLRALQGTDGGWSWYPGMPANRYTTVDVAILLARLAKLTDDEIDDGMTDEALTYLKKEIAADVEAMKKSEKQAKTKLTPSEFHLRYLYLRTLLGLKADDADSRFLLERATLLSKEFTMYGKALTAIVFAENGRNDEAKTFVESLLEHTVTTDEMGRYFDTQRAEWSWQSYRIPTQCAAIEAMNRFGYGAETDDMRLWLMQSKRTQMWETSRASADAVYALLATTKSEGESKVATLESTKPLYYTLLNGKKIVGFNAQSETSTPTTAAHFRQSYTDKAATEATTLKVRKDTDGLAWGAVYATFEVPAAEVQTEGKGMKLTRRLEVLRGSEWKALAAGDVLAKGDKVRQVFTLTADRDYDFVQLTASRPACLEPVRPLSGYQWADGLSAYRAVHDASTDYFIEQVRKGSHTFTEELRTDRAGAYTSGIATLQSVYAPEFRGTASELTLHVK